MKTASENSNGMLKSQLRSEATCRQVNVAVRLANRNHPQSSARKRPEAKAPSKLLCFLSHAYVQSGNNNIDHTKAVCFHRATGHTTSLHWITHHGCHVRLVSRKGAPTEHRVGWRVTCMLQVGDELLTNPPGLNRRTPKMYLKADG